MKKVIHLLLFCFCIVLHLNAIIAQNLIKNGSFEEVLLFPPTENHQFEYFAKAWEADYQLVQNKCNVSDQDEPPIIFNFHSPDHYFGGPNQNPQIGNWPNSAINFKAATGIGMAGISCYELIEQKLDKPLKFRRRYQFSMQIRGEYGPPGAGIRLSSNPANTTIKLLLRFSKSKMTYKSNGGILNDQVEQYCSDDYRTLKNEEDIVTYIIPWSTEGYEYGKWHEIKFEFISPDGNYDWIGIEMVNEEVLSIGEKCQFNSLEGCQFQYMMIDDLNLIEYCDIACRPSPPRPELSMYLYEDFANLYNGYITENAFYRVGHNAIASVDENSGLQVGLQGLFDLDYLADGGIPLPIAGNEYPIIFAVTNAVEAYFIVYEHMAAGQQVRWIQSQSSPCGFEEGLPALFWWNGYDEDGNCILEPTIDYYYQIYFRTCDEAYYTGGQIFGNACDISEGNYDQFPEYDWYQEWMSKMNLNHCDWENYEENNCIDPCPSAISVINYDDTNFVCEGVCTTVAVLTDEGFENNRIKGYEWLHLESGQVFSNEGFENNTLEICGAGTYQVSTISDDGCTSVSNEFIIYDFSTPLNIEKEVNLPCNDLTYTLTVELPVALITGYSFGTPSLSLTSTWEKDGEEIDVQNSSYVNDIIQIEVTEPGIYTFTLDYMNGKCLIESQPIEVTQACCVDYPYTVTPVEVDCEGNIITYGQVEFFPENDCGASTITVYGNNILEQLEGGYHTYTVPFLSDGSLTVTAQLEVPVIVLEPNIQTPPANPINQTICSGETAVIDLTGADSYSWETDVSGWVTPSSLSGSSSNPTTQIQQAFEVPYHFALPNGGSVTYDITAYYGDLCHQQIVGVTVLPHPNLELSSSVTSICPDEPFSIEIDGTANEGTQVTYTWTANLPNGVTTTLPVNGQSTNHSTIINQQLNNTSNTDQIVTYTVTATFANGCSFSNTIDIEIIRHHGGKICDAEEGLIVNEVYLGGANNVPYIELLVKGNSNCEPVDIRNFIVDDNNGMGNQGFANSFDNANVSTGHIRFKDIPRWAAVPSGSLIVIHDVVNLYPSNTLNFADDPDNSMGNDDAYVLPITDNGLEFHPFIPYSLNVGGTNFGFSSYTPPNYHNFSNWDVLSLEDSDAIQTRSPNGTYFHGISYGETPIIGGEDGLMIVPQANDDYILYFNGNNYRDMNHFDFSQDLSFLSPGLPNSSNNQTYINFLKVYGCDSNGGGNGGHTKWENQSMTWLKAYPNPTNSSMTIEYYLSNDVSNIQLKIYDLTARLILDASKSDFIQGNKHQAEIDEDVLKSGVYFCELSYHSKEGKLERDVLKLVKTK